MKVIADESVEREVINILRDQGFNVFSIQESLPGVSDEKILDLAKEAGTILLTPDKDFGTLVFQKKIFSNGVILYRLADMNSVEKGKIISLTLKEHGSNLQNKFCVISSREIRIRKI